MTAPTRATTLRPLDLNALRLGSGSHDQPDEFDPTAGQACLLEAAAWMAGEPWSDHPQCVSPVLGAFGRGLNDVLPDDKRQQLRPLIPSLIGTADDGLDETRSYMALDWLIRTYTPAWLDLAGLTAEATALRDLRRIVDLVAAQQAGPVVRDAQQKAATLAEAAGYAARVAALAAARVAAQAAARVAAEAVAEAVAWALAWVAALPGRWVAARVALKLTVEALQDSAIDLFGQMIRPA